MMPEPKAFRENPSNLKDRPQRLGLRRQLDNFSCGPASVFALWETVNYFFSNKSTKKTPNKTSSIRDLIYKTCTPIEKIGTSNESIINSILASNIHLTSHGEQTWQGDLAIANIRNTESGVGHFILLLKKEGDYVIFFDPILSDILSVHRSKIDWENSDGTLKGWSANTGLYLLDLDMLKIYVEPANFIVTEIDQKINLTYDVSTAIFQKLSKLNKQVVWRTREDLRTNGNTLFIDSMRVRRNDIVWIRLDPDSTSAYYETLRMLCNVEGIFVNSPSAILLRHDKFISINFRKTPIYSASSSTQLIKVINELKYKGVTKIAIKATGNCGGKDVHFSNVNEIPEIGFNLIDKYGIIIIEPYIEKQSTCKNNKDVRFLWIRNQGFIGSVSRESNGENGLCNLTSGGLAKLPESTTIPYKTLDSIDTYLHSLDGVFLAGVDWLNEKEITEINVSCPSVFLNFEQLADIDIISMIIEATQRA